MAGGTDVRNGNNSSSSSSGGIGSGNSSGNGGDSKGDTLSGGGSEACAAVARELPEFLAEVVRLSGSLRALAACGTVHRTWRRALGGDRGRALFCSIVRASGVPATLRPAVWQMLVLRTANASARGRGSSGSSGGGGGVGGGEYECVAVRW